MSEKANKNGDVPGNVLGTQALFDRQMIRAASILVHTDKALERFDDDDCVVSRVVIRMPEVAGGEYLAVVNMTRLGEKFVAFHRAGTYMECVIGLSERLVNGSIKWTPDKYG